MKGSSKQSNIKHLAQQRVDILFTQAKTTHKTNPKLATEYLKTAKKVAMSARLPLPPKYKHHICKHCNTLLTPGLTSRTRIQQKRQPHIVVTCLNCGNHSRTPITKTRRHKQHE